MRRLIDVARSLEPGARLRISELDAKNAKGKRFYTPPLTDAQIYAYQEWIVLRMWPSHRTDSPKQLLCIVADPDSAEKLINPKKTQEKTEAAEERKKRPEDESIARGTKELPEDQQPIRGTKEPSRRRGRPRKEAVKDG